MNSRSVPARATSGLQVFGRGMTMKAITIGFQEHGFWRPSRAICGLRLIGDGVAVVLFFMKVIGRIKWSDFMAVSITATDTSAVATKAADGKAIASSTIAPSTT